MKVNLFLLGAPRAGTTTLYQYLRQHPDICCSEPKEIYFFSFQDKYLQGEPFLNNYFHHCSDEPFKLMADTYILVDKEGPARIYNYNPDMKFLFLIRDPVERAFSNFQYAVNNGYEKQNISFLQALEKESQGLKNKDLIMQNNLGHINRSLYYYWLSHWMKYFPRQNFYFINSKALFNDPEKELYGLFKDFLNINPEIQLQEPENINEAKGSKIKPVQNILVNRNHPIRKKIRQYIPETIKNFSLFWKISGKLKQLNQKDLKKRNLTEQEKNIARQYFKDDEKKLRNNLSVSFLNYKDQKIE